MSKKKTPTSLSGGKGFGYEDYVAAKFLVDMLLAIPPFGAEFGQVSRVDWQAKDKGRSLDDLVITLNEDTATHVAECSVKMKRQVTKNGFPDDFTEAVWEQWLGANSRAFDGDNDLFVLITKNLADTVDAAFERLLNQAIATGSESQRLLERLANAAKSAQASKLQRSLFESLHCPADLQDGDRSGPEATARLLQRIRLLTFDFKAEPSQDEIRGITSCRSIVRSASLQDAEALWKTLVFISSQLREDGGTIDLPVLLKKLRGYFDLAEYPDHRADWATIHRNADDCFEDTQTHIGGHGCLVRADVVDGILDKFSTVRCCVASGPSGSGKSAIAKIIGLCRFAHRVVLPLGTLQSGSRSTLQSKMGIQNELISILERCSGNCLLIFDALDKCTDQGVRLAGRLIADIVSNPECEHVKILVTVQDESLDRMNAVISNSSIPHDAIQVQFVPLPGKVAVANLAASAPGVAFQNLNDDLKSLLQNLKVLDWVLLAAKSGCDLSASSVTGLVSLIDFLWKSWIEVGEHSVARSGLLKRIGEMETSSFSVGVPLDQLDTAQLQLLGSLKADNCVRLRDERVCFSHDLLGDWARLRLLIANDPTGGEARERCAAEPRWHRAVRLYGRWLLSRYNGTERWQQAVARVDDDQPDGTIICDLLLEAMLVAENSVMLLEQCWPTLTANEGRLLRRLLDRFMIVCTLPDLRFSHLFAASDLRPQLEAMIRLPNWPYWVGVALVLNNHVADIVRLASSEAAKACHLYLTKMPVLTANENSFPARVELSRVAVKIAEECQRRLARDECFEQSIAQVVYETLLAAASEFPEEVAEIALQLAHRRPPSEELKTIAEDARKARVAYEAERQNDPKYAELIRVRHSVPSLFQRGKRRKPWLDGPSDRLPNGLQEAILGASAIIPLAASRPAIAVELLLAASVEDPQYESWDGGSDLRDDCGVGSWDAGYPPLYLRGPFLFLLRTAPDAGLDYAIHLINFATKRYLDASFQKYSMRAQRDGESPPERVNPHIDVEVEGKQRQWLGSDSVFRWHLECSLDRKLVPCLLMAVEKWLEDLLDDNKDIDSYVKRIMAESESVAFAGVLISVAKRKPEILRGSMLPLLAVVDLYFWDRQAVHVSFGAKTWSIAWAFGEKPFADLAQKWHTAEHRKVLLFELATNLIAESDSLHSFFRQCCTRWQAFNDPDEPDLTLSSLIAQLNPSNYRAVTNDDKLIRFVYEPPRGLIERLQQRQAELEAPYPRMMFPIWCRKLIDEGGSLDDNAAEELFLKTRGFVSEAVEGKEHLREKTSAVIGGVAALSIRAMPWLLANNERIEWCEHQLESLLQKPASRGEFQIPDAPSQWSWESFACEAAILMLAAGRHSMAIRELSARGVVAFHYETTSRVMFFASETYERLGDDFQDLQHLAIRWSLQRRVIEHTTFLQSNLQAGIDVGHLADGDDTPLESLRAEKERLHRECDELIKSFVTRSVKPLEISEAHRIGLAAQTNLDSLARSAQESESDLERAEPKRRQERSLHRTDICIDTQVISSAFCWLGARAAWKPDRQAGTLKLVKEIRDLLLDSLPRNPDDPESEMSDRPSSVDGWMYDIVARAICLSDSPSVARNLWQPILELPIHLHDWTERFFWAWFGDGAAFSVSPDQFVVNWKEMIELSLELPNFDPDQSDERTVGELVFNLLGLKYPTGNLAKDGAYAEPIESMMDVWEKGAQKWMHLPIVANHFAMVLIQPAYAQLLCPGVKWLASAAAKADDYDFWRELDTESSVVSMLSECWERHSDVIRFDDSLYAAFNALLTTLASRGSHPATTLRDRVLDSLGNSS